MQEGTPEDALRPERRRTAFARIGALLGHVPTRYWVAAALYLVLSALFIHDWDGYVFETTVRDFYEGRDPYSVANEAPYYTFLNPRDAHPQWYAYPPLLLLSMATTFAPEIVFDFSPPIERALLKLPMTIGTLALAVVAGLWVRHLGHDEATKARIERLFLFNPFLILVGPLWGMTDPALMALFLLGLVRFDQARYGEAGVHFALSALVKPFPMVLGLPLLSYYLCRVGWRPMARAVAAGTPVVLVACLPFVALAPRAFWSQVIGTHLIRVPQGLTLWTVDPFTRLPAGLIVVLSIVLLAASLLALSLVAPRFRTPFAPLFLVLGASMAVLFWNRVVNEQYLVLAVAPLLLLYGLGAFGTPTARRVVFATPLVFTAITLIQGFHFITFVPPDVALRVFGHPVDVVARDVGRSFDWGIELPPYTLAFLAVVALAAAAVVVLRQSLRHVSPPNWRWTGTKFSVPARSAHAVSTFGVVAVVAIGFLPFASPATVGPLTEELVVGSLPSDPRVGAFYYLWWNNPAHDPWLDQPYGNWWEASQFPELGYYTQTRGTARLHAQMMKENGIDAAVVSYHTRELERYVTFQEEAAREGVLVAPLIELNQIYDQPENRPEVCWESNETGALECRPTLEASYRLTGPTRDAVRDYVLELKHALSLPNQYRIDGRAVIFFYDSYVSGFGHQHQERIALAEALLDLKTIEELRTVFNDAALEPTVESLLHKYPPYRNDTFYNEYNFDNHNGTIPNLPSRTLNLAAPWREAHFHLNERWWDQLREALEHELGPVFLVSGDAWNEQAGFYAGIVKDIENLHVFDGSFIYSPSFTWGVQPRDPENVRYDEYFALWTYRNLWLTTFANGLGSYSSFGVAPAYDDVPKRPTIGFRIPPEHNGTSTYDRSWEATLDAPPSLAILATFNEFFEGSSVEPSLEYGDRFLNDTLAYGHRLAGLDRPNERVWVLAHERASRTHLGYSEMDRPHFWGLHLVVAAGDTYTGAALRAVDGLEEAPLASDPAPTLLLLDGGREDYALSSNVARQIKAWVDAGTPTVIIGREVAPAIRALIPARCAQEGPVTLGLVVPGEEATEMANASHDDQLNRRDRLWSTDGVLYLDRAEFGSQIAVGKRCTEAPNVAFVNLKPWLPVSQDSSAEAWSAPVCLEAVVSAFFPLHVPQPRLDCVTP